MTLNQKKLYDLPAIQLADSPERACAAGRRAQGKPQKGHAGAGPEASATANPTRRRLARTRTTMPLKPDATWAALCRAVVQSHDIVVEAAERGGMTHETVDKLEAELRKAHAAITFLKSRAKQPEAT